MGRLNWNKRAVDLISTNGVRSRSVMSIRVTGVQSYLQKQRFEQSSVPTSHPAFLQFKLVQIQFVTVSTVFET